MKICARGVEDPPSVGNGSKIRVSNGERKRITQKHGVRRDIDRELIAPEVHHEMWFRLVAYGGIGPCPLACVGVPGETQIHATA
jgi:hypothetical protein